MSTRIETTPGADAMIRELGLDRPQEWASFGAGEPVQASRRGFVRRFQWPTPDGPTWFFKLYRLGRPWKVVRSFFRRDPAGREKNNLAWLRSHGFPAVEPVAWGCRRAAGIVRECFLVTRGEPALVRLDAMIRASRASGRPPASLRPRIEALARLVRRVHDAGFFAHDLHFRNVLCSPEATPAAGAPEFAFLDFPNGFVLEPGDTRKSGAVAYDLAMLERDARLELVSRSDRLRFLRAYLGTRKIDRDVQRAILRKLRLQQGRRERRIRRDRGRAGRAQPAALETPT